MNTVLQENHSILNFELWNKVAFNIYIYFHLIKSDNKVLSIKCPIKIRIFGPFWTFKMLYFG